MSDKSATRPSIEAQLRTVIDTAVDGMVIIDATGRIELFNPACERLFGYGAAEVIGQNVKILMPEPYHGEHDGYLANYRRTGEAKIIGIGREVVGRRKDGSTFPMDLSVGETREGANSLFIGIIRDISRRKADEAALQESAAMLRAVVDTAVDGVIVIDETGLIELFNPACERLFGYEAAEVTGHNVKMLMPEPYHDEHDGYLAHYHHTGERRIIGIGRTVVGRRQDGTTFPMDLSVGEARRGTEKLFVGVIRDISDRLTTEEQLRQAQKMEAVGQLTGGIAHDFNNLLAVISGNLELMTLKRDLGNDARGLADAALRATERGADLTRRLLTFARRQALKPAAVDVNEIIRGMGDLLRRSLSEMIAIHLRLAPDLWPAVIDRGQMENALLNLALNSRDAMPGGGELLIVTRNLSLAEDMRDGIWRLPAGEYVEIAVGDTGTGMTANMIAHAFEPFFTTKETGRGTGLGLSMVYGFVTQSGGQVKIYSEVGRGTTVKLYFNRDTAGAPDAAAGQAGTASTPTPPPDLVLIVEDDAAVRDMAVAMVESLGYRVHAVGDGHAALEALDRIGDIAILLTDVVLPRGLRGPDIVRQARLLRPDLAVAYMSGFAPELLSGDIAPEADAILIDKPFHRSSLSQALRTALERRGG